MARFGIVTFPGSNCDHDAYHAVKHVLGEDATFVWHQDTDLSALDVVVLPGGFSYGDYLRSGAIARFSPVMDAVVDFANAGGLVLGVCNGFQVLCEAGLLPGTLTRNHSLRFVCKPTAVRIERIDTPFTAQYAPGQVLSLPVAHGEGRYVADDATLDALESNNQVLFRYTDADGRATDAANPNGSMRNIAGICNEARNVLGLMPHPERHVELLLGSDDGRPLFESLRASVNDAMLTSAA
ncbi:MAG: phosphoribosylformylglycinamidine synthase subunit PurQ [Longimonas sp.]|uniref:phosphoribosylformylglycinamidine synthase subunit PurQ n=1 Tax=Longimonas sp. TaxID=2039626 RepID=UPI0039763AFC